MSDQPLSIERIENLYSWATAWNTEPDRPDLIALATRQREEFRAAIAEVIRAAREEGWNACHDAIDAHISQHGTSTEGWPENPYEVWETIPESED